MFGIGQNPDGTYFDSLAKQFDRGAPKGNRDGLKILESAEYQHAQWVRLLREYSLPKFRQKVILKLADENIDIRRMLDLRSEEKIKEKANHMAEKEFRENPPLTLIDKRFITPQSLRKEWEYFLSNEGLADIHAQVAETLYDELPENLKALVDNGAEEAIQERARRETKEQVIEQQTAASRAAIILNGGLPEN